MSAQRENGSGGGREASRPPDGEIVRRVLDGRHDDYGLLVRRYQGRLHGFALGMVGDADAAADLVQESFVKAYTRLESCREPSKFESWIFQIVRNRCRDYLKNVRRSNARLDDLPDLVSRRAGPDGDLARSELRRSLRDALETLSDSHREAFLLKHLHGHSYQEISEMLDASVSAVKMRVHRSREALRDHLTRAVGPDGDVTWGDAEPSSKTKGSTEVDHPEGAVS